MEFYIEVKCTFNRRNRFRRVFFLRNTFPRIGKEPHKLRPPGIPPRFHNLRENSSYINRPVYIVVLFNDGIESCCFVSKTIFSQNGRIGSEVAALQKW